MKLSSTPGASCLLPAALVWLALTGLLAGCGGGGGGLPNFERLILSYYITDSGVLPFTAAVRDQVQMLAFGETAGGEHQTLTDQVTWSSSDPAAATISDSGWLAAVSRGTTDITITYGDLEPVSLTVTVEDYQDMPTTPYFPFGRTYYWAYEGTSVSTSPTAQEIVFPSMIITTPRQVVREGQIWWELQIQGTDPTKPPGRMWLRHQQDGLVEYVGRYWLKEPLQADNQWQDSDPEHYWEITATDATVTVPAGTFNDCFQVVEHWVNDEDIPYDSTAWFAPEVGLVKSLTEWIHPDLGPQTDEQCLREWQFELP